MAKNRITKNRDPSRRLLLAAALLLVAGRIAHGQQPETGIAALRSAEAALVDLISRVEPSVVAITRIAPSRGVRPRVLGQPQPFFQDLRGLRNVAAQPAPVGAGVVIDEAGLVLTQYLVVKSGDRHLVTTVDGETYEAEIRGADPRSGLAVLAATESSLAPLAIGRAENLRKGSGVVTVGNPNAVLSDGQPTASYGTITNLARKAGSQVNLNNARDERLRNYRTTLHHFGALIQTDARLGWNASGGAMVNLDGELVGVTTTVSVIAGHEQPAGYAIPLNETFRRIVDTLKSGREVEYGLLGIQFSTLQRAGEASGIVVQQAVPGSPASRAGLRPRDLITRIDGAPVSDADRLQLLVGRRPPGAELLVTFQRDGAEREATVLLGKHLAVGEKIVTEPAPRWRGIRVDYSTAISRRQLDAATQQGLIDPRGCVVVTDVEPGSVSEQQGVKAGVFISHVNGERVTSPQEFWTAVEGGGGAVKLRFVQPMTEPNAVAPRR